MRVDRCLQEFAIEVRSLQLVEPVDFRLVLFLQAGNHRDLAVLDDIPQAVIRLLMVADELGGEFLHLRRVRVSRRFCRFRSAYAQGATLIRN